MKWEETKFKSFLDKVGNAVKDNKGSLLSIAGSAATGSFGSAISKTFSLLSGEDSEEAKALLAELELKQQEFALEEKKLIIADRDSARSREVEIIKAGGKDIMMNVAGSAAIGSFVLVLITVLFFDLPVANEKLIYHVLGIVEGVAISVFSYYFGSSKAGDDLSEKMNR